MEAVTYLFSLIPDFVDSTFKTLQNTNYFLKTMQKAAIAFLILGAFCMVFPIVPKGR